MSGAEQIRGGIRDINGGPRRTIRGYIDDIRLGETCVARRGVIVRPAEYLPIGQQMHVEGDTGPVIDG